MELRKLYIVKEHCTTNSDISGDLRAVVAGYCILQFVATVMTEMYISKITGFGRYMLITSA